MTENIGIVLNELVKDIVPFYFAEAQVEDYPYAVYDLDVTPVWTKSGIHHYEGAITINIYDKDLDNADAIAEGIREVVFEEIDRDAYSVRETFSTKTCVENEWDVQIQLTIKQYK